MNLAQWDTSTSGTGLLPLYSQVWSLELIIYLGAFKEKENTTDFSVYSWIDCDIFRVGARILNHHLNKVLLKKTKEQTWLSINAQIVAIFTTKTKVQNTKVIHQEPSGRIFGRFSLPGLFCPRKAGF